MPLIADLIRDASNINDWVLDCFAGGGTVFIAAEKTTGVQPEWSSTRLYVDLAIERWQKFIGKKAILVETGQTFDEVAAERLQEPTHDRAVAEVVS